MADPPVKVGDLLAGKYQVERILGSGGMGIVVSAWHQELEQRVAVKFLLPEIAERTDAAERFRREARAAVKIRSEHVARILDVGTLDGVAPYMVMEYLDGHDLAEELRLRGKLPIDESVDYILQVAEAVAEAHSAGIVHRDLKPANLFLTRRSDGTRAVKVLDFGISKSVVGGSVNDLSLTRTSSLIGSPLYMSPEQMKSARDVDARTDIWAIGTILFEMLAGRPPYVAESIPQLCASLLNESPPPLAEFRNDVPPALETVVLRCLAKDRALRWPNVAELAQNLIAFAPLHSRVHADRARRLLGGSDVSVNKPSAVVASAGSTGTVVTYPSLDPLAVQGQQVGSGSAPGSNPAAIPPRTGATLASWGKTGDSTEAKVQAQRKRRLAAVLALAGAVGAAGLLALFHWAGSEEPGVSVAVAQPEANASAPVTPASPPANSETKVEAVEPPKLEAMDVAPAGAAAQALPASTDAGIAAEAAKHPGRPLIHKRLDNSKAPADSQQNKSVPSSISDFGGRR